MEKYLVTGGAGFIGSHLVERLVRNGKTVTIIDNLSTGDRTNLSEVEAQIDLVEGDILNAELVEKMMQGVEKAFHLAAFVSAPLSVEQPEECFRLNIQGTTNILEAARRHKVKHVVLASSAAVYGDNTNLPLSETEPSSSLSPYAATKRIKEVLADLYTNTYQLPVTALRFFNVYGARQSPESQYAAAVPIFIDKLINQQQPVIYGDGEQTRDLIYIDDVVNAMLLASETPASAGETLNICTGVELSINALVKEIIKIINPAISPLYDSPRPGDILRSVGSPAKAEKILDFKAQTDISSGLKNTIDWMRNDK